MADQTAMRPSDACAQTGAPEQAQASAPEQDQSSAPTQPAAPAQTGAPIKNTNRWSTRQLVTMALLCAIGVLLSFIEFPIFPAAPFLKYDASFVPAMVGGFAYGPGAGIAIGIIGAIIHGLLLADLPGCIMNIIVVVAFTLPAGIIYKKHHTFKGATVALIVGAICSIALAIACNLVITPLYMGVPVDAVIAMILPILLPFNLIKACLNAVLTAIIYKSISNLITPKKKQVVGR